MIAYTYDRYGPPEVVRKVTLPSPVPGPEDLLIEVHATTVSAADWRLRSLTMPPGLGWVGRPAVGLTGPRKPILGTEFSGIVVGIGRDVSAFSTGDAVIGFPGADLGAHAEFIVMPQDGKLVRKPDGLPHHVAAAIPFGATTAYDYLINKGQLQAGEEVLINGASGATGSACVQIATHLGARVTAVCSSRNTDLVRAIGARDVIDYETTQISALPAQYDMVVDTVGTAPWSLTRHLLKPGGRMMLIAGNASDMILGGLKARMVGKRLIAGVAREDRDILTQVVAMAEAQAFHPVIDRCFRFDDMVAAHRHVETRRKVGNVVVILRDPDSPDTLA